MSSVKPLPDQGPSATVEPPRPAAESLGALLRRTRCARGLELAPTAQRLRTKAAVIEALENDNYRALGAPVFVRMYLIRYGELLGLPEHEVLSRYKALGIDQPPPLRLSHSIRPQARASDLRWLAYPVVFALVGWLGWSITQQRPSDGAAVPDTPSPTAAAAAATAPAKAPRAAQTKPAQAPTGTPTAAGAPAVTAPSAPPPADEVVNLAASHTKPPAGASAPTDDVAAPVTGPASTGAGTSPPATGAQPAAVATTAPAANAAAMAGNQQSLKLSANADCWVEVRDANGKRLVYSLLGPNDSRTVTGSAPFSITLGNAQAVQISLNGQPVDRSVYVPEHGSVSKFVLKAAQSG